MCLVADGSPVQTLAALIVTFFYMMFVLKTAPFLHDNDDLLSFVTSLGDGSSAVPLAAEQWQHSDQPYSSDIESDIEQKRHHKKNIRSKNPG